MSGMCHFMADAHEDAREANPQLIFHDDRVDLILKRRYITGFAAKGRNTPAQHIQGLHDLLNHPDVRAAGPFRLGAAVIATPTG
eukprot:m.121630 g.121630  ORF g.121630 m.121630 type:complete len:84 (-) comp9301_c0_seq5:393-644(-)